MERLFENPGLVKWPKLPETLSQNPKRRFRAPHRNPQVQGYNMLTHSWLWPTGIKLNPSWKMEVSKSAWIKPWLRYYKGISRLIQAYSARSVILTYSYSQPCHILSPGIFRTGGLFKTLWNVVIASWHIFRTRSYLQQFTTVQNSDIFKTWHIFRTLSKI